MIQKRTSKAPFPFFLVSTLSYHHSWFFKSFPFFIMDKCVHRSGYWSRKNHKKREWGEEIAHESKLLSKAPGLQKDHSDCTGVHREVCSLDWGKGLSGFLKPATWCFYFRIKHCFTFEVFGIIAGRQKISMFIQYILNYVVLISRKSISFYYWTLYLAFRSYELYIY